MRKMINTSNLFGLDRRGAENWNQYRYSHCEEWAETKAEAISIIREAATGWDAEDFLRNVVARPFQDGYAQVYNQREWDAMSKLGFPVQLITPEPQELISLDI